MDGERNEFGTCVFGFECCIVEEHVWVDKDPQLTRKQSQVVLYDPGTREIITKGTHSLVNWIKATIDLFSLRTARFPQ